jgi:hypothetical protein
MDKKIFYAVHTEVYSNGQICSGVVNMRKAVKKPAAKKIELPGMTASVEWYDSGEEALSAVQENLGAARKYWEVKIKIPHRGAARARITGSMFYTSFSDPAPFRTEYRNGMIIKTIIFSEKEGAERMAAWVNGGNNE